MLLLVVPNQIPDLTFPRDVVNHRWTVQQVGLMKRRTRSLVARTGSYAGSLRQHMVVCWLTGIVVWLFENQQPRPLFSFQTDRHNGANKATRGIEHLEPCCQSNPRAKTPATKAAVFE